MVADGEAKAVASKIKQFAADGDYAMVERKQPWQTSVLAISMTRQPRFRSIVIFFTLLSWLFMLLSATCTMAKPIATFERVAVSDDCAQAGDHAAHPAQTIDCSLQQCPDSQPNPPFSFKLDQPDISPALLCLIWLSGWLFAYRPLLVHLKRLAIPPGKPVALIYRYCILLN